MAGAGEAEVGLDGPGRWGGDVSRARLLEAPVEGASGVAARGRGASRDFGDDEEPRWPQGDVQDNGEARAGLAGERNLLTKGMSSDRRDGTEARSVRWGWDPRELPGATGGH